MSFLVSKFADDSGSGLAAFNINLKTFLFQLITFVLVLLILRRWAFPKLVATLEERQKTLEASLTQAKKTEEALAAAETKATDIIHEARAAADQTLADARTQAKELIDQAEAAADVQAERVMNEASQHLVLERQKLHDELKEELTDLVVATTAKVLGGKLTGTMDAKLIQKSVKELK